MIVTGCIVLLFSIIPTSILLYFFFHRQGNGTTSCNSKPEVPELPSITFDDKDEYGDWLRKEIDKAYHDKIQEETDKNIKEGARLQAIKNYNAMRNRKTEVYDDTNDRLKAMASMDRARLRGELFNRNSFPSLTNYL